MATDIKIVISGRDEFSPAFDALDDALSRIIHSGDQTAEKIAGMENAIVGAAASTQQAGQTAAAFAQGMGESFTAIMESQQLALEEIAAQQEATTLEVGERLLEIDAEFLERRHAQRDRANARERQQQSAHLTALVIQSLNEQKKIADNEMKILAARLQFYSEFFTSILELAESQGRSMTTLAKTLGVAQALVDTYRAVNNALASVPYPFNLASAAVVLTKGLANVQRIRQVSVAHGGLGFVPSEQTFLLDRGERVLSASQNRDLTGFLASETGGGKSPQMLVENLTVHVLENATSGDTLLDLEQEDLRQLVAERIVPALDELSRLGIRPVSVERNT